MRWIVLIFIVVQGSLGQGLVVVVFILIVVVGVFSVDVPLMFYFIWGSYATTTTLLLFLSAIDSCTLYKKVWQYSPPCCKMLLLDAIQLKELLIEEISRVCITSKCAQILQILLLLLLLFSFCILSVSLSTYLSLSYYCVLSLHVFFVFILFLYLLLLLLLLLILFTTI